MVAKPETLSRFIFNSDYPTDKIIWLYEGQFTTPSAGNTTTINIDVPAMTGSNYPIFVKGAWSLDNWQTSYMLGTTNTATTSPAKYITTGLIWETYHGSRLRLDVGTTNSAGASKSGKYRMWGVQRDDIDFAIDYNKNSAATKSKLIFNSENNYPRLYKEGVAKSGDVIEHSLGRIPYIDYWYSFSNNLTSSWTYYPHGVMRSSGTYNWPTVKATDKQVTFTKSGSSDVYYYYRIYA